MRVVNYNIQYSRGRDEVFDLERIAAELSDDAHVIALQEVERNWPRSGMQDQPARLAELLPDYFWVYGAAFDVAAPAPPAARGARRQHGLMVLSRTPIVSKRLFVLPKVHYDKRFNMYQGALETVIETPLGLLRFVNVHLGYLDAPERLAQLDYLTDVSNQAPVERGAWSSPGNIRDDDWSAGEQATPVPTSSVWLGDFNSTSDSEEYARLHAAGLTDARSLCGHARDQGYSHSRELADGTQRRRRLDYCFVSAELAPRVQDCCIDIDALGSDHRPVWTRFD